MWNGCNKSLEEHNGGVCKWWFWPDEVPVCFPSLCWMCSIQLYDHNHNLCVFNSTKFSFISSLHDKPVIEMVVQKSIVAIALSYKVLQNKSVWLYKAWVKFYFYEYVRNHDPHVQACILGALALTLIRWYAPSSNSFSSQVGGVLLEHC
jgi:hypothetical protein